MADTIIGKTVGEAMDISEAFLTLMTSRGNTEPDAGGGCPRLPQASAAIDSGLEPGLFCPVRELGLPGGGRRSPGAHGGQ
jgi:hypothetical protein